MLIYVDGRIKWFVSSINAVETVDDLEKLLNEQLFQSRLEFISDRYKSVTEMMLIVRDHQAENHYST